MVPGQLTYAYASALGLTSADEFRPTKSSSDTINGFTFVRYQQYHNGVLVEGGDWTEHSREGKVRVAHGDPVEFAGPQNVVPLTPASQVLEIAAEYLQATRYGLELNLTDSLTTALDYDVPVPELVFIAPVRGEKQQRDFRLCWKLYVSVVEPEYDELSVYVNAKNGEVERAYSNFQHHYHDAALDYGYGIQSIDVKRRAPFIGEPYFYLRALTEANVDTRRVQDDPSPTRSWGNYGDHRLYESYFWGAHRSSETTAHFAVSNAFDYFGDVHGRRGWDGSSKKVEVLSNSTLRQLSFIRGRKTDGRIIFGPQDAASTSAYSYVNNGATLDIAGHEFTHGIISYDGVLEYAREPGALNESFADIFGVLAEDFGGLSGMDWQLGEDCATNRPIRDLSDPQFGGSYAQPDTYQGSNWRTITSQPPSPLNDNQWVHFNSGVQNRWFSLLADGGSHNGISVQGLGRADAARIAFLNMTQFMQLNSQYADAREGAINSARILFGRCSFEVEQTTNAWSAVGVGQPFDPGCLLVTGPSYACAEDPAFPLVYYATAPTGVSINWQLPSGFVYSASGPGNNRLSITRFPYSHAPDQRTIYQIQALSSAGGSDEAVLITEPCRPPEDCGFDVPCSEGPVIAEQTILRELTIYPNPVSTILTVRTPTQFTGDVTIYDLLGKRLVSVPIQSSNTEVSFANLPGGTYLVNVWSSDGSLYGSRRVIRK